MTGDRAIRWSTIGAVSVVALVAAFVSYRHALTVVRLHGESGKLALAYPLTIDGMIYASSMVLLNAARRGAQRPWLAYAALGLGIAATLAANIAAGLAYGPVGAIVAAWPAPALVISYELLMLVIRSAAAGAPAAVPEAEPPYPDAGETPGTGEPDPAPAEADGEASGALGDVPAPPAGLNGHAAEAAELFAADLAAGRVPSIRDIRAGLRVGQDKATEVQGWLRTRART